MRKVKLGSRELEFPSEDLQQLEDSNHLLSDVQALKREFNDKGYLFLRGFHDSSEVLAARLHVLSYIRSQGEGRLDASEPWQRGVLDPRCGRGCLPFMEGKNEVTESEAVRKIFEGRRPYSFFSKYFGAEVLTFDFKWLRAIHTNGFTGAHVDNVYMGRGSPQLLTMWTPIGNTQVEMGTLAVCEGSHRLESFKEFHATYGSTDLEREGVQGTGWFTLDPVEITCRFGGVWKTSDFSAGDVLIFGMSTVHMSTVNLTNLARISCDTRWQPRHHPVDERYVGEVGPAQPTYGLYGEGRAGVTTINTLKEKWGFT